MSSPSPPPPACTSPGGSSPPIAMGQSAPDPPLNRHQAPLPEATHRAAQLPLARPSPAIACFPFAAPPACALGRNLIPFALSSAQSERSGSDVRLAKSNAHRPSSLTARASEGGGCDPIRLGRGIALLTPRGSNAHCPQQLPRVFTGPSIGEGGGATLTATAAVPRVFAGPSIGTAAHARFVVALTRFVNHRSECMRRPSQNAGVFSDTHNFETHPHT
uniref:Predicted protein n=1 Tax=Physcomitrium patens TaxID=3218 RepID=A9U6T4_PHYPA